MDSTGSTIVAGCIIKSGDSRNLRNTTDGNLIVYPKTIDRFPMDRIVIPGHGQFGGFELIKHTKELSTK